MSVSRCRAILAGTAFAMFATGALAQTTPTVIAALPRIPLPKPAAGAVRASANQNREPAGILKDRVLTLALDVVNARWRPESDNEPELPILAFAERGRAPLVPGPLVRVPVGTEVHLTIHNRSDSALVIGGLRQGPQVLTDTVQLAAGGTRELRYRLAKTGSWFYWGAFRGTTTDDREWLDSQLSGAVVVDAPGASTRDQIFVMGEWFKAGNEPGRRFESSMVINGRGFPHTERLTLPQGDSVRFRVINTMSFPHPMHLHGFYYRVEEKNGKPVPAGRQLLSNTDLVDSDGSEVLSFLPTTPGNWVFHCHFAFHIDDEASIVGSPADSAAAAALARGAPQPMRGHSMRGLVIALQVTPKPGYVETSTANARKIKLLVQRQPGRLPGPTPAIGFIEQKGDTIPPRDKVSIPGPVLELKRGQPVAITVKNNLDIPTAVHWHGLEIESFPDGVPHWSGLGSRVFSEIAPGDSFVAAFVPPRSGTFPYHSHLADRWTIGSGMYGAIIVSDKPRDLAHDHLIVTGGGGPVVDAGRESPYALVNGSRNPGPMELTAGEVHRIRIVTLHPDWAVTYSLRNDASVARWRAVAKDGADIPAALATMRPANVTMGPGETADFEFTPPAPGRWRVEVGSLDGGWRITVPLQVTAKPTVATKK
jgi:FtsP/CotA-like multicopper oxidase with cupredoxin domain